MVTNLSPLVAISQSLEIGLPVTFALAAIALIGYLFGNRTRAMKAAFDERRQHELDRAARIAWQLETIATRIRQDLVTHHSQLATFKRQLRNAQDQGHDQAWAQLCNEAEAMLGPIVSEGDWPPVPAPNRPVARPPSIVSRGDRRRNSTIG